MAKVRVKLTEGSRRAIKKLLQNAITERSLFDSLGKFLVKRTQGFTREGKNPGTESAFKKKLSPSWIKSKAELAEYNAPDPLYAKGRNNLTFSGQLLRSLKFSLTKNGIVVTPTGVRQNYKTKDGRDIDGPDTNKKLAELVIKQRNFLTMSGQTRKLILNKVKSAIRRSLGMRRRKK